MRLAAFVKKSPGSKVLWPLVRAFRMAQRQICLLVNHDVDIAHWLFEKE
jgi:hypothetical protein